MEKIRKKKLIDMHPGDRFESGGKKYTITEKDHKCIETICDQTKKYDMWPIKAKVTPLEDNSNQSDNGNHTNTGDDSED